MLRVCWLFICVFYLGSLSAQQMPKPLYSGELSYINDNDAFLLQKKDAYYTNGLFIRYTKAGESRGHKLTRSFEIGQMIYTPLIRKTASAADIDRPYSGYLYLGYQQNTFRSGRSVLQTAAKVGIVGSNSFGEELQNSYHSLLGYGPFYGWKYQVRNALGLDLGLSYARTVFEDSSWIQWVPRADINLGTTFTNAKLGAYLCIGSFENHQNSALWNARVQKRPATTRRNHELFVYWYPQLIFQGYNATIEGGLFSKGNGAVLGQTNRFMFQQNWGLCFAKGRVTTRIEVVYQTREAVAQTLPQRYASLQFSYGLH